MTSSNLLLSSLLLLAAGSLALQPAAPRQTYIPPAKKKVDVQAEYDRLAAAGDLEGLGQLWLANEDRITPLISAAIGAAMMLKDQPEPGEQDLELIAELEQKGLFGARAATEATGRPIFLDYAASMIGWSAEQRRSKLDSMVIRERCLAHIDAQKDEGWPQYYDAIGMGSEVKDRALALGDWLWVAIGHDLECLAHQGQGHVEEAMIGYSRSRLIYRDLGLFDKEFGSLRGMLKNLVSLERWQRALPVADAALDYARAKASAEMPELLAAKAQIHRGLGQEEQAKACDEEIEGLAR